MWEDERGKYSLQSLMPWLGLAGLHSPWCLIKQGLHCFQVAGLLTEGERAGTELEVLQQRWHVSTSTGNVCANMRHSGRCLPLAGPTSLNPRLRGDDETQLPGLPPHFPSRRRFP